MADQVEVRTPVPLRTIPGVELAAIGTWKASTGETTFTPEDFDHAVAALQCPGIRNPVIKLGHQEDDSTGGVRWDGEPAVGWVANMRFDDDGKMRGDLKGVPAWLADPDDSGVSVLAAAYPDRSIEIYRPFECQIGHLHPSVITALSLLGVSAPGVGVLKSMQDVYATFTQEKVAAAAPVPVMVRLAAPDEPREPNAHETRARVDFAADQKDWQDALDALLEQWPAITADQRAELTAQVEQAVDADDHDGLGALIILGTAAASAALVAGLRTVADNARAATIAEAKAQGVEVDPPEVTDDELIALAGAVAGTMAASTASAAGGKAAQLLGAGTGSEVAGLVDSWLVGMSDRFWRDNLGGALSGAQAIGRRVVLESAPTGEYYASEVNDVHTCAPCRSIDGARFDSLDAAEGAYGSGKYASCLGGARCRGRIVAVWGVDTASAKSVRTTVHMSIGETMPTRPGLVQASVSVEEISRQYYESAGYSMWITAMHVDPLELIVSDDATGKFYQVPVELKGDTFTFADAQEVAINYVPVKSTAAAAIPYRWSDRKAALAAVGMQDGATPPAATTTGAPAVSPIAPDVSPAGAAIRKMAATVTVEPETQTPDAEPATGLPTDEKEASGMTVDAAKLREALGLPADAELTADVLNAAVAELSTSTTPGGAPVDPAALLSAIPDGAGVILLDRENYKTLLDRADQGVAALAAVRAGERDTILEKCVREGRFPVAKLSEYSAMWDNNPDATRKFLELIPKNSIPTRVAAGFLGQEYDKSESDLAYESMYPKGVN